VVHAVGKDAVGAEAVASSDGMERFNTGAHASRSALSPRPCRTCVWRTTRTAV